MYESEMIAPIISFLQHTFLLDSIEKEFSAGYGIADIVGVKYNKHKIINRYRKKAQEPVTNIKELSIINILKTFQHISLEAIANKLGLSKQYIQNNLLKSLSEKGYVAKIGNDFLLTKNIVEHTDLVISIEAKLNKWKDALAQAKRYQHFSNYVFVALPKPKLKNIDRFLFKKNNIGVLSLYKEEVKIELKPQKIIPRSYIMNLYCNEYFYSKYKENRNS